MENIPFRVLIITDDTDVFVERSSAQDKILEFSKAIEELYVIVCNTRKVKPAILQLCNNTWIYATNSLHRMFYPLSVFETASAEVTLKLRLRARLIVTSEKFSSLFPAWILSVVYKRKLFIDIESEDIQGGRSPSSFKARLMLMFARFILNHSAGIRVVSEEAATALATTLPKTRNKITVLPAHFDAVSFSKCDVYPSADLHKMFPQFNIIALMNTERFTDDEADFMVDVVNMLQKRYIKFGLIVVAPGREYAPVMVRARSKNIEDHIIFITSDKDIQSYYKTANIFWGICKSNAIKSLREAAASGTPIVTLNIGVASSVVSDGESGFICKDNTPGLFMRKVVDIMEEPGLRESMRIKAQENAIAFWNKDLNTYLGELRNAWYKALQDK